MSKTRDALLKKIDKSAIILDEPNKKLVFRENDFTYGLSYAGPMVAVEAIKPLKKGHELKVSDILDRLNGLNETTFFEKYFVSKEGFFTMSFTYNLKEGDIDSQIALLLEYVRTQAMEGYLAVMNS